MARPILHSHGLAGALQLSLRVEGHWKAYLECYGFHSRKNDYGELQGGGSRSEELPWSYVIIIIIIIR